ncbi:hypothetical protein CTA2_3384 [Colletotrichum tanaceti]|uniref:Uncharacterized protein n=1 Tax=Colletotrichum tanaceti TaxID=1306861 RepID=A0A4U6XJ03_9PEZI|nr:hypothetical protein CTA2_3384 [Colletotrichum tanaceti]TKW55875.1 hypothetical protein CTA1_11718 [Colletotrichum tanaceti]
MKGVNPVEVDKNAVVDNKVFNPTLKDYRIFTEELAETYDLAAKTFGTGTDSPVYKELAAFEPLVSRIRQERLSEMRMAKTMLKNIVAAFKGIDLKTTTYRDPIDIFGDTEARRIIQERFQLQDLPDYDPRIKAEWKNW